MTLLTLNKAIDHIYSCYLDSGLKALQVGVLGTFQLML